MIRDPDYFAEGVETEKQLEFFATRSVMRSGVFYQPPPSG